MKKFLFLLVASFCCLTSFSQTWDNNVEYFISSLKEELKSTEKDLLSIGLDVNISASYDKPSKEIVIDLRFSDTIWNVLDDSMMKGFKQEMLDEYKNSFKTNPDFKSWIDLMKENKVKFKILMSCLSDGKIKSKHFYITPEEIIK